MANQLGMACACMATPFVIDYRRYVTIYRRVSNVNGSVADDEPGAEREQHDAEDLRGGDRRARDAEPAEVVDHDGERELARDRRGGQPARAERPHGPDDAADVETADQPAADRDVQGRL